MSTQIYAFDLGLALTVQLEYLDLMVHTLKL